MGDQFDPALSNPAFDPELFEQSSFLQPPSENAAYSNPSFTSTPVEFLGDRDVSADLSMRDVDTAGGEGDLQICYGMVRSQQHNPIAVLRTIDPARESKITRKSARPAR